MFVVEIYAVSSFILFLLDFRWELLGRFIIIVYFIRRYYFVREFKYDFINILFWGKLKGEEMNCFKKNFICESSCEIRISFINVICGG